MKTFVEYVENKDRAIIHHDSNTVEKFFSSEYSTKKDWPDWVDRILKIDGVVKVWGSKYQISFEKGRVFDLEAVIASAKEIMESVQNVTADSTN